ncbi:hypothetical protein ACHQM5_001456 [Ranunculus cassubicifolius]
MVLHLLAVAKLKLLLSATHLSTSTLNTALVLLVLKFPFTFRHFTGTFCNNVLNSARLFVFRLRVIVFEQEDEGSNVNGQRWVRALRLVRERATNARHAWNIEESHEESLHLASMVAL